MKFSRQRLHEVYLKSCAHEGFLNIYIYRKLSIRLAVIAAKLGCSPNQVSGFSFAASMMAAAMFVPGDYHLALWALIPFHIGKILDCADGQLASLTNQRSKLGAFLDPFFDRVSDLLLLSALALGYHNAGHGPGGLYIMGVLVSIWFLGAYLDVYGDKAGTGLENLRSTTKGASPLLRQLLKWDGGFTGLVTTLAVLTSQIPLLLVLFLLPPLVSFPLQLRRVIASLKKESSA